jgi:tetratricopeptide (TPR) repeat protein
MLLGSCFAVLALSCAANIARPGNDVGVTSLQGPDVGGAAAEPAEEAESPAQGPIVDPRVTEAASALGARDYARVLALTEAPSVAPDGAWLAYDRASALAGLGRTDEAVEAFRTAETRFHEHSDDAGRAVAIWGRARVLALAGRCAEAREAYEDYEAYVKLSDPRGAEMAARYAGECRAIVLRR